MHSSLMWVHSFVGTTAADVRSCQVYSDANEHVSINFLDDMTM